MVLENELNASGFELLILPKIYKRYFIKISRIYADRCVDGRSVVEKDSNGTLTGFSNENYLGPQFPGGTLGILDTTILITKIDEKHARDLLIKAYHTCGFLMGGHIDDDHGKITKKSNLLKRLSGCGNQKSAQQKKIHMLSGIFEQKGLSENRIAWLRKNKAEVPPLAGDHSENLSSISFSIEKVFDTANANLKKRSIFNLDIVHAQVRAAAIYDELNNSQVQIVKDKFVEKFTSLVIRNYLQTIVALGGEKSIYLYTD
jgi:hypothetical protein